MARKILFTLAIACGVALGGCESSPTDPDSTRPQFDGRSKTVAPQSTTSGGAIGDPCTPETYSGPYRCIPSDSSASGYIIAY